MMNTELAAALRAIPGVEDAEIGAEEAEHEGVRVRLTSDADPNAVAEAVRAILADRGLRSRMAPPRARVEPSSAPPPPFPVAGMDPTGDPWKDGPQEVSPEIDENWQDEPLDEELDSEGTDLREPDYEAVSAEDSDFDEADPIEAIDPELRNAEPQDRERPESEVPELEEPEPEVLEPDVFAMAAIDLLEPEVEPSAIAAAMEGLASLRLEEDRHGVTITAVANDGTVAVRKSRPQEEAIQNGVIAAVSALFDPHAPAPAIVAVEESEVGEAEIVTVVLDDHDGNRLVGAAVMGAERGFAVARATFAALADR